MWCALSLLLALGPVASGSPVIVHEWGTFTSVAGEDGLPVRWRALVQPFELPSFVHEEGGPLPGTEPSPAPPGVKRALRGLVRLETPVLYVHTDRPADLAVQVDFPEGRLTEWYPPAAASPTRLAWQLEARPGETVDLPRDGSGSPYYAARLPRSAPLTVTANGVRHAEAFLFYRGVGEWSPPLFARWEKDRLALTPLGAGLGRAVIVEARGERVSFRTLALASGTRVPRPRAGDRAGARAALLALVSEGGLYPDEAEAMLATWDESWFEEGLRVFYVVPPALVDRVLPLQIRPAPAEVKRVLVGRLEVLTPERIEWAALRLAEVSEAPSPDAVTRLGRFAEPLLECLKGRPHLRARAEALLAVP